MTDQVDSEGAAPTTSAALKPRRRLLRPSTIIIATTIFVLVAIALLLLVPGPLVAHWLGGVTQDATTIRLSLTSASQTVLFALGGFIALVGVGLSLSRHGLELDSATLDRAKEDRRIDELSQQRRIEAERELRTRFTNSVALLSDPEKVSTRQAGVYALAALADDWHEFGRFDESQVCIDVLCGYLRSGWDPSAPSGDGERRIRAAGFDVIGAHLRPRDDRPTWHDARFNLRGALIDFDVDMARTEIREHTEIDLRRAEFRDGTINLQRSVFAGGLVNFEEAQFGDAILSFRHSRFRAGVVDFSRTKLEGGALDFGFSEFTGGDLVFSDVNFFDGGLVFHRARFLEGDVTFRGSEFNGARADFRRARFGGSDVDFGSTLFSAGNVHFGNTEFTAGSVDFAQATLNGGIVKFDGAVFTGTVDSAGKVLVGPPTFD